MLNRSHVVVFSVMLAACSSDPATGVADSGTTTDAGGTDSATADSGGGADTGTTNAANTCAEPPNLATAINETQESSAFPTTFAGGTIATGVYIETRRGVYAGGKFDATKTYKITSYVDASTKKFLTAGADFWIGGDYTISGSNVTFNFTCGPQAPAQVTKAFEATATSFTLYDLTQKFSDVQTLQ